MNPLHSPISNLFRFRLRVPATCLCQEFIQGCLRLRGQAKAIDLATLIYMTKRTARWAASSSVCDIESETSSAKPWKVDIPYKAICSFSRVPGF